MTKHRDYQDYPANYDQDEEPIIGWWSLLASSYFFGVFCGWIFS